MRFNFCNIPEYERPENFNNIDKFSIICNFCPPPFHLTFSAYTPTHMSSLPNRHNNLTNTHTAYSHTRTQHHNSKTGTHTHPDTPIIYLGRGCCFQAALATPGTVSQQ